MAWCRAMVFLLFGAAFAFPFCWCFLLLFCIPVLWSRRRTAAPSSSKVFRCPRLPFFLLLPWSPYWEERIEDVCLFVEKALFTSLASVLFHSVADCLFFALSSGLRLLEAEVHFVVLPASPPLPLPAFFFFHFNFSSFFCCLSPRGFLSFPMGCSLRHGVFFLIPPPEPVIFPFVESFFPLAFFL